MLELIDQWLRLFRADSIYGVALRGVVWVIIVSLFIIGLIRNRKTREIKATVGWFLMMCTAMGIISYILFGYIPTL